MGIYQLGDRVPQIDPSAYVFETATLIGTVILGARVSIWPYATLRGDNEPIEIGDDSNVQECAVLNGAVIGRNCLIGAGALITEGKQIPDGSLVIGSPAKVVRQLEPAHIERMKRDSDSYVRRAVAYRRDLKRIS